MTNLKITDLKSYLKYKSNDELIKDIVELAKLFPAVKEYYALKLNSNSEKEAFDKYKKIIKNEFFPDRGFGKMGYSKVNKAISDFKKVSENANLIAELMLYYAEVGVDFTDTYGDIDEKFYSTIERAYANALDYIFKNNLEDEFIDKAEKIMENTGDIGWGFHDNMSEIYYDYYGSFDEEDE